MTRPRLSPRDRRALIGGAMALAVMAGGSRGRPVWLHWRGDTRAAAEEAVSEAARAEAGLAGLRTTVDSLKVRRDRLLAASAALFGAESPGAAAAALSSDVSGAASSAGLRLGTIEMEADAASRGMLSAVRVRGSAEGDIRAVAAFLMELERGPRLLAVERIELGADGPRWRRGRGRDAPAGFHRGGAGVDRPPQDEVTRRLRHVTLLLWGAAAIAGASAAAAWRPPHATEVGVRIPTAADAAGRRPSESQLASATDAVVEHDPFRLDRRPSETPFQAAPAEAPPAEPDAAPAPTLTLTGTVGGPPWDAIVEGIPGHEGGVAVRRGDRFGDLTVRSVGADSAVVSSPDSTWVLRLKGAGR